LRLSWTISLSPSGRRASACSRMSPLLQGLADKKLLEL
jgi:hypothetical protein